MRRMDRIQKVKRERERQKHGGERTCRWIGELIHRCRQHALWVRRRRSWRKRRKGVVIWCVYSLVLLGTHADQSDRAARETHRTKWGGGDGDDERKRGQEDRIFRVKGHTR